MANSHSLAAGYIRVPETLSTIGNAYQVPEFPYDGPEWLVGISVLFISADGPELPEIDVPMEYLRVRGAKVKLAGQDWIFDPRNRTPLGHIIISQWLADNICVRADLQLSDVHVADYEAIFIPGGAWNPDMLRTDRVARQIIRDARAQGRLIVSLCHGPQVLISANALDGEPIFPPGTRITGVNSIRVDLTNAGFTVFDEATVYDEGSRLLTARDPNDLGPLCMKMGDLLRR
jgi:deglycase